MNKLVRKKSAHELFRNTFAVYLHLATDKVIQWLHLNTSGGQDALNRLKGENNHIKKEQIWSSAKKNIFFIEWLERNDRFFMREDCMDKSTHQLIEENYSRLILWIELLFNVRNYWSHSKHPFVKVENGIDEILLELYLSACSSSTKPIPDNYKGLEGLFFCKKDMETFEIVELTKELSITGYAFFTSLFLDGQQINHFLEDLEKSNYDFEKLEKREEFRLKNPDSPYPDYLTEKKKYFLYAREVYTYWKIRGHRDNIIQDQSLDDKISYYSILEYLKRCPKERIELTDEHSDAYKEFSIMGENYVVREKDKFMEWGLEFWDDEANRLGLTVWKWARHQTPDEKHKTKLELEARSIENGRPYRFPRHKKVLFDLPLDETARLNDRNDEHGFPYFFLKDDFNVNTQGMFRFIHPNGKSVIGLMGSRMLCSILEYYLWKFPIENDDAQTDKNRKEFWKNIYIACFEHIAEFKTEQKSKQHVTSEKIKNRIELLEKRYAQISENEKIRSHEKILFILQTWNQIITYGQSTNLAHANDKGEVIGGKRGYQQIMRYLTLMDTSITDKRIQAHDSLIRLLNQLGIQKSKESYFSVINRALQSSKASTSPFSLRKFDTVECYFNLCKNYRSLILNDFRKKLADFNVENWRPSYEMRWLGLKDERTHLASQQNKSSIESKHDTNIINIDNKLYSAVGLPRELKQLTSNTLSKNLDNNSLDKVHLKIYPSPNNCTLIIPDFYTKEGVDIRTLKGDQHKRKRLYLTLRQDTVLSHIAYKKGVQCEGIEFQNVELKNKNFQEIEMILPICEKNEQLVSIKFYYRYFKQNRYQLPQQLTIQLFSTMIQKRILEKGSQIMFNRLRLVPKENMPYKERVERYLSADEKNLPFEEKNHILNERFNGIKPLIFDVSPDNESFYLDEILNSYSICRRAMIEKIFKLEKITLRRFDIIVDDAAYIPFRDITKVLKEKQVIDELSLLKLEKIRNAAFHFRVPDLDCLPDSLIKPIQHKGKKSNQETKYYMDIFGVGIALIDEIINEINSRFPEKNK